MVAERGCSHDLARAALAEAATMRAHYTVGLLLRLYRHVPYLDLDLNHHFDALAAARDQVGAVGADAGDGVDGGGGEWDGEGDGDSGASSDDDSTDSGENCTSGSSDGDKHAPPVHWSYDSGGDRFDAAVRVKGAAAWTATDVWQTFVNALDPVTLLIIISMLRRLDMRVPWNLANLAWCAAVWVLRTGACHGDDTRISAMLKEWAATRSTALHADISNHIFRRRMYYHVMLFVDTIVSWYFFPDTFNILFSTFYPFNSLTPKSPGEPLVRVKMAVTHVTIMVLSKLLGNLKFIFAQRGVFELPFTRNVLMLARVNLVFPHAVFGWRLVVQACELVLAGRALHCSTSRLNLSAFCGIGVHLGVV